MVSEPTWRKHNLQEEKRHYYNTYKLGLCKRNSFQLPKHLESCALPQGSIWHLECTFSVAGSLGKWNLSFTKVPEVPKVPEYQKYRKHQSRNPQIRFDGVKIGFSQIQGHQATRLSQAHLLVKSKFDFEHFHFLVIFVATSTRCLQAQNLLRN